MVGLQQALRTPEELVQRPVIDLWRLEDGIHCDFDGVFEHGGDDIVEYVAAGLKAGVGVDFYEPGMQFLVDHEVIPEDLKGVLLAAVPEVIGRPDGNSHQLPHCRQDVSKKVNSLVGLEELQVFLEGLEGDLVAVLILAVLCCLLLDCVVGEVDVLVAAVLEAELEAGGSDVACRVEIGGD